MAIPKNISKSHILEALKYIDENGVPDKNKSTKYELVTESGKKYPPKYVIAVANHLTNNEEISTEGYNAVEAKSFLEGLGFVIETKQEKFELIITANEVKSTDEQFTMNNLGLGDNYKPLDTYFKNASGMVVRRKYNKGERRNSNQTMPRLAFQIFEDMIEALPNEEKENFPICQYTPTSPLIRGIFSSVEEFKKHKNTIEYLTYSYDKNKQFVIYCWNIFSTILFVQECLKRFGHNGDQFVLTYREKEQKEDEHTELVEPDEKGFRNPYSNYLIDQKILFFAAHQGRAKHILQKKLLPTLSAMDILMTFLCLVMSKKSRLNLFSFIRIMIIPTL